MSLHDDLLEQARHLAARERRGRPRQASLRRAISAAYYSVFHLLIDEAAKLTMPGKISAGSRSRIGRSFDHVEMKKVSHAFASALTGATDELSRFLQAAPPRPADLISVASAFVELQEARHEADYNTALCYTRQQAAVLVNLASEAFQAWRRVRSQPEARTYLIALIIWKKWNRL